MSETTRPLTFEAFVASKRPVPDDLWEDIVMELAADGRSDLDRSKFEVYGTEVNATLLEIRDDGFYPHTWWYDPILNETRAAAEKDLYNWYLEFE